MEVIKSPKTNPSKPKKTIGLALGGGAVLGAAHIGALKAIRDLNIEITHISGTSIGALVASLYAFNDDIDEIEKMALQITWSKISKFSPSKIGLFSNRKMKTFLEENIGIVDFSEARIPLSIVASNIANGEKVVLETGDVANAVMASMSIPGIFKPITIDKMMLVDGGIVENVPITPLLNRKVDVIIAVDVNSKHYVKKPVGITDILLNSFHHTIANATKVLTSKADILIQPDLSGYNYHNTDQSAALIEQGYEDTIEALKNVKHLN